MANWETQFTGPATGDTGPTVELQRQAIAAQPDAVGFTRIDTTSFDDNIREAQDQGVFAILFQHPRARGTKISGSLTSAEIPQPAAETGGYQCGKFAQEIQIKPRAR